MLSVSGRVWQCLAVVRHRQEKAMHIVPIETLELPGLADY
jgi:hypothetical protein